MASVSSGDEQQSDQNLRVYVCNTFLHVKDAEWEAEKEKQMKRSFSDSSLGSRSASDKELDTLPRAGRSSPPPIFNTVALGYNQLQFPNGSGQLQLPNGPRSHSPDECPQHMVWNDLSSPWRSSCSSDSAPGSDRDTGLRAEPPDLVRQYHSDGQTADGDDKLVDEDGYLAVPMPERSTWSEGAAGHEEGSCKPCAWNWKAMGCSNAATCQFCHMCPKDTLKENRKAVMLKLKKLKKAAAAANAPPGPAPLQPGQVSAGTSALVAAGWQQAVAAGRLDSEAV